MSANNLLYKIVYRLALNITPVILVLISVVIMLPNSNVHKKNLKSGDFYSQLSQELQSSDLTEEELKKGFSQILISTVMNDLATPGWLQNLFEQNIDLTTSWLKGEKDDLALYLPSKEIEVSIIKNIDEQTQKVNKNFDIPTCSKEDEEKIKREGFDLTKNLCLPENVKNGQQKLTENLEINKQTAEQSQTFDKVIRNSVINPFNETFKASDILSLNETQRQIISILNWVRNGYLRLRNLIPVFGFIILALFITSMILAKISGKILGKEIRRYFFYTATGILSLSVILILSFGGFVYLNGQLQNLLIPGIGSQTIVNLLSFEAIKFTFNLVSLSVWIALGLLIINFTWQFLENSGALFNLNKKNKKLQNTRTSTEKNPTFDGDFRRVIGTKYHKPETKLNIPQEKNLFETKTDKNYQKIESQYDDLQDIKNLQNLDSTEAILNQDKLKGPNFTNLSFKNEDSSYELNNQNYTKSKSINNEFKPGNDGFLDTNQPTPLQKSNSNNNLTGNANDNFINNTNNLDFTKNTKPTDTKNTPQTNTNIDYTNIFR